MFWEKVRDVWSESIEKSKTIKVNSDVDGKILFSRLFGLANDYKDGNLESIGRIQTIIDEHIDET